MAGDDFSVLEPAPLANLRVGIAQGMPLENLDETVGKRFLAAIDRLERAGCRLSDEKLALLDGMCRVGRGGILPADASPCIATGSTGGGPRSTRTCACGWSGRATSAPPTTSGWRTNAPR